MGNYELANAAFLAGDTPTPDIIATRRQGRHKYGFGLNFEQEIAPQISSSAGWAGATAATNRSPTPRSIARIELGAFATGESWPEVRPRRRRLCRQRHRGRAPAISGYGRIGFLLGDGGLTYGPEKIFEGFYTTHLWRGFFASFDLQHINNPGYNMDRGPVLVPGLRFHVEF